MPALRLNAIFSPLLSAPSWPRERGVGTDNGRTCVKAGISSFPHAAAGDADAQCWRGRERRANGWCFTTL